MSFRNRCWPCPDPIHRSNSHRGRHRRRGHRRRSDHRCGRCHPRPRRHQVRQGRRQLLRPFRQQRHRHDRQGLDAEVRLEGPRPAQRQEAPWPRRRVPLAGQGQRQLVAQVHARRHLQAGLHHPRRDEAHRQGPLATTFSRRCCGAAGSHTSRTAASSATGRCAIAGSARGSA